MAENTDSGLYKHTGLNENKLRNTIFKNLFLIWKKNSDLVEK